LLDKEYILRLLKEKKEYLFEKFGVKSISLFGSFARDEYKERSDIDFYVEMPASYDKIFELKEFLENIFQRKVDIIRKRPSIRKRFIEEIEKEKIDVE
jgi:predicted nucleotidyltransferase